MWKRKPSADATVSLINLIDKDEGEEEIGNLSLERKIEEEGMLKGKRRASLRRRKISLRREKMNLRRRGKMNLRKRRERGLRRKINVEKIRENNDRRV